MIPVEELLRRWEKSPPPPARTVDVEKMLVEEYQAYEIPVSVIPASDYEVDNQVTFPGEIYKLYTITDPRVLNTLFDDVEREMFQMDVEPDPEITEQDWRHFFDPPELAGYTLLRIQQAFGQRLSILLCGDEETITDFRVYNMCQKLQDRLLGLISWNRLAADDVPEGYWRASLGDLDDVDFVRYLKSAYAEGLLPDA